MNPLSMTQNGGLAGNQMECWSEFPAARQRHPTGDVEDDCRGPGGGEFGKLCFTAGAAGGRSNGAPGPAGRR